MEDVWQRVKPSGPHAQAEVDGRAAQKTPSRAVDVPAHLLDLSRHYNAALDEAWHNPEDKGNNLDLLPVGLQEVGGVRWDIRGIIQLDSLQIAQRPGYPEAVTGIAIGQSCARVQFLLGGGWRDPDDTEIARFLIHYEDGDTLEAPVVYGRDVRNWQYWPEMPEDDKEGGTEAWRGTQERWKARPGYGVRLYRMTWENPHPEKTIATIDFVSAMQDTAPFLIAITLDPLP